MQFTALEICLLIVAGIVTGIINTIAGSGTIVSMGTMIFLGIPPNLANTTNRFGVLFQNLTGVMALKHEKVNIGIPWPEVLLTLFGAATGAIFAANLSVDSINVIIMIILIIVLAHTIVKLIPGFHFTEQASLHPFWKYPLYWVIGFYGGFIQIGVGLVLLVCLKSTLRVSWKESNYIKLLIILIYTIPTTIYFLSINMVVIIPGLLLAVGQIPGAYLSARFMSRSRKAEIFATYFVLTMIVVTIIKISISYFS